MSRKGSSSKSRMDELDDSSEDLPWISWFCGLRGNEFFCEVDHDYISDIFNLQGLSDQIPHYKEALEMILDADSDSNEEDDELPEMVEESAEVLYGLIHARYILTYKGIRKMVEKYQNGDFGYCPRVFCDAQPMLPLGLADSRDLAMVKQYCPKCMDVYTPKYPRYHSLDGAYFGTGFADMLFMVHPELRPQRPTVRYKPRLFGFEIHPSAYAIQLQASKFKKPHPRAINNNSKRVAMEGAPEATEQLEQLIEQS